mmetsp:Transcript_20946/g.41815  ORF Transcript_20946/g.41815 Transcript_20946/m.41815 type:complete len:92 (-) Transcript_20946:2-277(-)
MIDELNSNGREKATDPFPSIGLHPTCSFDQIEDKQEAQPFKSVQRHRSSAGTKNSVARKISDQMHEAENNSSQYCCAAKCRLHKLKGRQLY